MARRVRKMARRLGPPTRDFMVVYSDERLNNAGTDATCDTPDCHCSNPSLRPQQKTEKDEGLTITKKIVNGSLVHITGIFGFTMAGLVIQAIYNSINED